MRSLTSIPSEPGRSASTEDGLPQCRHHLRELFDVPKMEQVILLPSCTHAVNAVVAGIAAGLPHGSELIAGRGDHNAVLRPLMLQKERYGVSAALISCAEDGRMDVSALASKISKQTSLICVTHASNVTGAVAPIEEIAALAAASDIPLLIDAAQSAGSIPISYRDLPGKVYLAFAGHKGLLGPTGIGGVIVPDDTLPQTVVGGTGIRSERLFHPTELPTRHEAGTPNLPGIAGLSAGVRYVLDKGAAAIGQHKSLLVNRVRRGLQSVKGVRLYPAAGEDGRAGVVSFTLENQTPEDTAFVLRNVFEIETRAGLHCAPLIHREIGSHPMGTVRASVGPFNTEADVERFIDAVTHIATGQQ